MPFLCLSWCPENLFYAVFIGFHMLNKPCNPETKPNYLWFITTLTYSRIWCANTFWGILVVCLPEKLAYIFLTFLSSLGIKAILVWEVLVLGLLRSLVEFNSEPACVSLLLVSGWTASFSESHGLEVNPFCLSFQIPAVIFWVSLACVVAAPFHRQSHSSGSLPLVWLRIYWTSCVGWALFYLGGQLFTCIFLLVFLFSFFSFWCFSLASSLVFINLSMCWVWCLLWFARIVKSQHCACVHECVYIYNLFILIRLYCIPNVVIRGSTAIFMRFLGISCFPCLLQWPLFI